MSATPQTDSIARGNHVVPTEWAEELERSVSSLQDQRDLLERERDELHNTIVDVLRAIGATDYEGPRMAALRVVEQRNNLQDQRDFCMGEIERLRKERDEAREALREILTVSKGGVDKIVLLAKLGAISGIAESALNHLEDAK